MITPTRALVLSLALSLCFFSVPNASRAASAAEIAAQIAALQAQLAALQGSASSPNSSVTFTRDLTIGSTGADVTALQSYLIKGGYGIEPNGASGYFDTETRSALAQFQHDHDLSPAAGYFGPITRAYVNAHPRGNPDDGSISITRPTRDEGYEIGSNLRVGWKASDVPKGSTVCIVLISENGAGRNFAFPADAGGCEKAKNGSDSVSAELVSTSGYQLEAGEYLLKLSLVAASKGGKDGATLATDAMSITITDEDEEESDDLIEVEFVSDETEVSDDQKTATFQIDFDVTAIDSDIYVPASASAEKGSGITYAVEPDGEWEGQIASLLRSSTDKEGAYFVIEEGDTERFTLTVVASAALSKKSGTFWLEGKWLEYNTKPAPSKYSLIDLEDVGDFETDKVVLLGTGSAELGTYKVYTDGKETGSTKQTKKLSTELCKLTIQLNKMNSPEKSIRCTWNGELIGEYAPPSSGVTGTYIGYLNGRQFIRTEKITEADALANCKLNEKGNPSSTIYCTWKGWLIHTNGPSPSNATTLSVTAPSSVSIGKAYMITWKEQSGRTLKDIVRLFPNAHVDLLARNTNLSLGIAQWIGKDLNADVLLSGKKEWNVGSKTNDGRALPAGTYKVELAIMVPEDEESAAAVGQGTSGAVALTTSAETPKPSCKLTLAPNKVMLGQKFTATWSSANSTKASLSHGGGSVAVNGSKTMGIANEGDYLVTLTVTGTGGTATCTATMAVTPLVGAKAAIDKASLTSSSATPTLTGTATNIDAIYVTGSKVGGGGAFSSATATVKNGVWSVALPTLGNGQYSVSVVGPGYKTFATGVLAVSAGTTASATVTSALTVTTSKPTISGTATEAKKIGLLLTQTDKVRNPFVYETNNIAVSGGKWSHKITYQMPNGTYRLKVLTDNNATTLLTKGFVVRTAATSTQTSLRDTALGSLLAGVGAFIFEIPKEFAAIFTRG